MVKVLTKVKIGLIREVGPDPQHKFEVFILKSDICRHVIICHRATEQPKLSEIGHIF